MKHTSYIFLLLYIIITAEYYIFFLKFSNNTSKNIIFDHTTRPSEILFNEAGQNKMQEP